ncbi:MAG: hypothetical protein GF347_02550 [Candidatus Moranbacteria bacterium]|nr:hypothetical protein [Candidatus Moranbacteria bacterium]
MKIDLPSRRVVNYLVVPFSILSAYFIFYLFYYIQKKINKNLAIGLILSISIAVFINGYADSITYFTIDNQYQESVNLYHAARYLRENTRSSDKILKDHANLKADSFLKYFFQRGYDYVLSRTFDYKYEQNKREQCTYLMATQPDTEQGKKCYSKTDTRYVILKKDEDNLFFDFSENFNKIYDSDAVVIYMRKG